MVTVWYPLVLIGFITLVLGVAYAWLIAHKPFPSGYTWVSVLIGCAGTNLLIAIAQSVYLHSLGLSGMVIIINAFLLWFGYVLTGGSMIAGQLCKDRANHKEMMAAVDEIGRRKSLSEKEE